MDKDKVVTEEEESFLSLLLNNQAGYSVTIADALAGQSFDEEMRDAVDHSVAQQVDVHQEEPPAKEVVASKADAQVQQPLRFRKAIPPSVLKHLTLHDPKRARRIIANRMSASRAKEKKKMHIFMLESEVQNLQTEWNDVTTQLNFVQNEGDELTNESVRLKERVTLILQRISLQDELNEQIRKEVQYLKSTIGCGGLDNFNNGMDPPPDNGTQQ